MTTTTAIPAAEMIREDSTGTYYAVPVTLRQIEAHGIELDGRFGLDEEERAEMRFEAGLLRLVFGVELCDTETGSEVGVSLDVECYESRRLCAADWHSCTAIYNHAAGHKNRIAYRQNRGRMEILLAEVAPDHNAILAPHCAELEAWLAEASR